MPRARKSAHADGRRCHRLGGRAQIRGRVVIECRRGCPLQAIPALVEDTYEAFLSVPLISAGDIIGIINVHHREAHRHGPDEIALLTFVGEQMGNAIAKSMLADANARLLEETAEMKRQLERGNWWSAPRAYCSKSSV